VGITPDFMIKHVRPYGMDAYRMVCSPGARTLSDWLLNNGVTQAELDAAFNIWAQIAILDINDQQNLQMFVTAADAISQARWQEYYATAASTIMFLNDALLKELSLTSEREAGNAFDFEPYEVIPLAVTIQRQGGQQTVARSVNGAHLAADGNGDCVHFAGLIP
jgi:hypothetical protein